MLREIETRGVGPAEHMKVPIGERLTLISGDNGLGKSFILDLAWWLHTGSWSSDPIIPRGGSDARIHYWCQGSKRSIDDRAARFDAKSEQWSFKRDMSPPRGTLAIYAKANGSYAVYDFAKGTVVKQTVAGKPSGASGRGAALVFSQSDVLNGIRTDGRTLCDGLIYDWTYWQRTRSAEFSALVAAIECLAPPGEGLRPGEPRRISVSDSREIPTIRMPYGEEVPITQASDGIKRVLMLCYLLVWTWREHKAVSYLKDLTPKGEIVMLVDEIELHIHPRWQRSILPALLDVTTRLKYVDGTHNTHPNIQLLASTHSPLVFASLESLFSSQDKWIDIDLLPPSNNRDHAKVEVRERTFERHRDANGWLLSKAFDLTDTGSREAEAAIAKASAAARKGHLTSAEIEDVERDLALTLSETDPTWSVWRTLIARKGAAE